MLDPRTTYHSLRQAVDNLSIPAGWRKPLITTHSSATDVWINAAQLHIPFATGSEMFEQCLQQVDQIARKGTLEEFHRTLTYDGITTEGYIVVPQYLLNPEVPGCVMLFTQSDDVDALADTLKILYAEFASLPVTPLTGEPPEWDLSKLSF